MSIYMEHNTEDRYLLIRLTGRLEKDDYRRFVPEVERLIGQHGKVNMLLELEDFHGWTAGALWEDFKFDLHHFSDIERLAVVGEKKWHRGMTVFCKPFTTAGVRYFGKDHADQARQWISRHEVAAR